MDGTKLQEEMEILTEEEETAGYDTADEDEQEESEEILLEMEKAGREELSGLDEGITDGDEDLVLEEEAAGPDGAVQEKRIVGVRFRTAGKSYYFAAGDLPVCRGTHVIVETSRGLEYGTSVCDPFVLDRKKFKAPVKKIVRIATPEDENRVFENRQKEKEAFRICQEKIRRHGLEMKLIDAEYTFDGSKILFYFTSDGRVDFRDLVKDLAGVFRTRIELRQIGVRDETKILGGYGICGRPLCCHTYLSDFAPVSIRMAKEQNLSLNPTKISGSCGRLMCCLKNEAETYEELNKNLPGLGDEVEASDGLVGNVAGVDVLRQLVRILVEVDDEKELHEYRADQITILRRRKRGQAKPKINRSELRDSGRSQNGSGRGTSAGVRDRRGGRPAGQDAPEKPADMKDTRREKAENAEEPNAAAGFPEEEGGRPERGARRNSRNRRSGGNRNVRPETAPDTAAENRPSEGKDPEGRQENRKEGRGQEGKRSAGGGRSRSSQNRNRAPESGSRVTDGGQRPEGGSAEEGQNAASQTQTRPNPENRPGGQGGHPRRRSRHRNGDRPKEERQDAGTNASSADRPEQE